ncbi:hypothetical protein CsSME_00000629 [Camellia sinensis var. sinensis]
MTKKGSWISALKKALTPESKGKTDKQKTRRSNSRSFGKHESPDLGSPPAEPALSAPATPPREEEKLTEVENEQDEHAYSVALATAAVAAEAAVAAAQAAAEVVWLTNSARYLGKSEEEVAAIKIQTAFRGYLARRALRALRGLVRLKSLIQGQSVKRQSTTTLQCMQTLARVQSQVRARRIRMREENQALQRQLQQKHEKELEKLRTSVGEDWNSSAQSKEQIEGKLHNRQEAAVRRERALAYAYSRQQTWKTSSKSAKPTYMDPNNPQWGWSWLERWMAARPWETRDALDRELNSDHASVKSSTSCAISVSDLNKPHSHQGLNLDNNKPSPTTQKASRVPIRLTSLTPISKAPSPATKTKPGSSKGSAYGGDDDLRSVLSVESERHRRHSFGGSSVRDVKSIASLPGSSHMTPKKSAKMKSGLPSPSGNEMPEKGLACSARKRLSYPSFPAGSRRLSGPPKLETGSAKDTNVRSKAKVSNGGSR